MVPYNYTDYIDDLTSLVHKGIINMSRIDDAVMRILRVKFTMGLFENPLADLSFADQLGKKVGKLAVRCLLNLYDYKTMLYGVRFRWNLFQMNLVTCD